MLLMGCAPKWWTDTMMSPPGVASEERALEYETKTVHMPFDRGYRTLCVQGPGGSYSHRAFSTAHDLDFDTPNDRDDPVFAPAAGTLRVHGREVDTGGFGLHVNIDLGDETYIVLAHLRDVFLEDGAQVAAGQLIGFEGTTGRSTGDHVHMGRHSGLASRPAEYGESIPDLSLYFEDVTLGTAGEQRVSAFECALPGGHVYESQMATPRWHPNGSLLKHPASPDVFLLEDGRLHHLADEEVFWERGYRFADLALITAAEMACYEEGEIIREGGVLRAFRVHDGRQFLQTTWDDACYILPRVHWEVVLETWGIAVPAEGLERTDAYLHDCMMDAPAQFREGTLVKETSRSDVYAITDGVAMPIASWDTFLLLGFGTRTIYTVPDGAIASVMGRVGDCAADVHCITRAQIETCGGGTLGAAGGGTDEETARADSAVDAEAHDSHDDDAPGADSGVASSSPDDPDQLRILWRGDDVYDRISLSGEFTGAVGGFSEGWVPHLAVVASASQIEYLRSMERFDTLRFSVEFEVDGRMSWSCLAPFPPGLQQGEVFAFAGDIPLEVVPVADPESAGCGLMVTFDY